MYNFERSSIIQRIYEKHFFLLWNLQSVENELTAIKVLKAKYHFEYQQEKLFFRFVSEQKKC